MDSLNNAFQFYCSQPAQLLSKAELKYSVSTQKIVYTDEINLKKLQQNHSVIILKTFENYPNESILKDFIWYKKRAETLDKYYLIRY